MGTKRNLAPLVRDAIARLEAPSGLVADLFSGMGSVASALAGTRSVLANDDLAFTTAFAKARFLNYARRPPEALVKTLVSHYLEAAEQLNRRFRVELSEERRAMDAGQSGLQDFMLTASHVGNSAERKNEADIAARRHDLQGYCLASLYFAAGYFSYRQTITLDAIRFAIDTSELEPGERSWALAAWLAAAGTVINAPGHTAQFLKPTGTAVAHRIIRAWRRDPWEIFVDKLATLQPIGTRAWRAENLVTNGDAIELVTRPEMSRVAVAYADPPYTKDHYSRFYHVYETLYRYDYPSSTGVGRYRDQRSSTGFSLVTQVETEFRRFFAALATRGVSLVLSYPSEGLLRRAGVDVEDLLGEFFQVIDHIRIDTRHSTLGASSGSQKKKTQENIYVCKP